MEMDRTKQFIIATVKVDDSESAVKAGDKILSQMVEGENQVECEDADEELQRAWDEVSGEELHPEKGWESHAEETGYIKKTNL